MNKNSKDKKTRAFICIDFPPEVIKESTKIQSLIEKQNFAGKLTEPENLHLTLKFLGHILPETLSQTKQKLPQIKFPPLDLKIEKAGTFNIKGNPKIAWLKITGNIHKLQAEIDTTLQSLFQKEKRFMSHLTIARIKHVKDKPSFTNYINNIKPKPIHFQISEFKLKSSTLKSAGPVYKTLQTYYLDSSTKKT